MTSARPVLFLITRGDHRLMRRVHRWDAPRRAPATAGCGWRSGWRFCSSAARSGSVPWPPRRRLPGPASRDQFSFPSGHSITAFAVAVSIGAFYPAPMAGLLLCAASVAASRILLGMHFLTDVVAGAARGIALGCASAAMFA